MSLAVMDRSIAAREPIGLDELVERAELLTRIDRKYVVTRREAADLMAELPAEARVLEIDHMRSFGYLSSYLDTPQLHSYLGAGRSHRRRWKVRTRAYLDAPPGTATWLEVKTRSSRGQTLKRRVAHPAALGPGLTPEGHLFVSAIIGEHHAAALRPTLATAYRRSTFFLASSDTRVTLDVDLSWSSLRGVRDFDRPGLAIIETKTGSTPSAVDRLLWSRGHRPLRISKFGVGMAALDPTLPRLKWHRVLDRHLGLTRAAAVPRLTNVENP